jgi:L-asparaginase / beta-aspartyl-peptidase
MSKENLAVIVHGGAEVSSSEDDKLRIPFLKQSSDAAWETLNSGKSAEEAVVSALSVLEASEYFDAGYGGYPNQNGIVLLDVGLMRGDLKFLSLMNVRRCKFPSRLALEMFEKEADLLSIWTHQHEEWLDSQSEEKKKYFGWVATPKELIPPYLKDKIERKKALGIVSKDKVHGTVGCVVRDAQGNICSGTSTGGIGFKRNGRIGDSPIIGAGVFADNEIGGLSASGNGEAIMKTLLSQAVILEMKNTPSKNLNEILKSQLENFQTKCPNDIAGLIVIPKFGKPAFAFCAETFAVSYKTAQREETLIARR